MDKDGIALPGTPERDLLELVLPDELPQHVAIIMDGNGRWAQARNLPRVEGHRAGIRAVRASVETAARLGIPTVTLYAFSTENWKRPALEVKALWGLAKNFIDAELDTFKRNNLRFRTIGDISRLDTSVQRYLKRAMTATAECTGTLVQIALNYSGRNEITRMVRNAVNRAADGDLQPESITEQWIDDHLDTAGTPDPDLLIRTSGEFRLSNFLLWQVAYSEIYISQVLWPDFDAAEFLKATLSYQKRERRFGGLSSEPAATAAPSGESSV